MAEVCAVVLAATFAHVGTLGSMLALIALRELPALPIVVTAVGASLFACAAGLVAGEDARAAGWSPLGDWTKALFALVFLVAPVALLATPLDPAEHLFEICATLACTDCVALAYFGAWVYQHVMSAPVLAAEKARRAKKNE